VLLIDDAACSEKASRQAEENSEQKGLSLIQLEVPGDKRGQPGSHGEQSYEKQDVAGDSLEATDRHLGLLLERLNHALDFVEDDLLGGREGPLSFPLGSGFSTFATYVDTTDLVFEELQPEVDPGMQDGWDHWDSLGHLEILRA
jgi:hypothetical protein